MQNLVRLRPTAKIVVSTLRTAVAKIVTKAATKTAHVVKAVAKIAAKIVRIANVVAKIATNVVIKQK